MYAVSFKALSCPLLVYIGVSVAVSLLAGALAFIAGLFAGMCLSKRRFKAAGQLPFSTESINSTKTAPVHEEIDLYSVKPQHIQLIENPTYVEIK